MERLKVEIAARSLIWVIGTCIIAIIGFVDALMAQDASFSQFYNNPVYYNPANAGSLLGLRARLNYRNQWNSIPGKYNNYSFSMDVAEPNIPGVGGIGLIVNSDFDGIGNIRTTSATSAISARIQMSREIAVQAGISASYVHRSIDWSNFVFSDQIHPVYGIHGPTSFQIPESNTVNHPDFGCGLLFKHYTSSNNFRHIISSLSVSLNHVFQPDISFTGVGAKLPHRLAVTGDFLFEFKEKSVSPIHELIDKFNPGFIVEKHGTMTNFILGFNFNKSVVYTGMWLRSQHFTFARVNDLIMLLGLNVPFADGSNLKFMYSYDYTISNIRRTVGATHEIYLIFELENFSFFSGSNRSGTDGLPYHQHRRVIYNSF